MSLSLSIIIPTYKRPDYLKRCLDSCLEQDFLPSEIIVGDDSPDDKTHEFIKTYKTPDGVNIRYLHHKPSKGQALNVAALFKEASCDIVGLMHDDDFFFPHVFGALIKPFEDTSIIATFGKHMICDDNETFKEEESEKLAQRFYKSSKDEGVITDILFSGYSQQFPNNSFFVRNSDDLHRVYTKASKFHHGCDTAFSLFFAQTSQGRFYFVNLYSAAYRQSHLSICRGGHYNSTIIDTYWATYNVKGLDYRTPKVLEIIISRALGGACELLKYNKYFQALRIIFGRHLGWRLFFTTTGWRWIYRQLWPAFLKGMKK